MWALLETTPWRYHREKLVSSISFCKSSWCIHHVSALRRRWLPFAELGSLAASSNNHNTRRFFNSLASSSSRSNASQSSPSATQNEAASFAPSSLQVERSEGTYHERILGDHSAQAYTQCSTNSAHTALPSHAVDPYRGSSAAKENVYAFPTGRALRMLRRGRRHCYHCHANGVFVEELVTRCRRSLATLPTAGVSGEAATNDLFFHALLSDIDTMASFEASEACIGLLEDDTTNNLDNKDESGSDTAHLGLLSRVEEEDFRAMSNSADAVEEASRFVAYHCHHVLTEFRLHRKTCFNRDKKQQRPEQPKSERPPLGATLSGLSHPYSAVELGMLMDYTFQASVLLHLTGLYGVGEKYLEPLLDVCLSVSIFLSQAHNFSRHKQAQKRNRESRGMSYDALLDASLGSHWHSLHWAVVHYCEAVRLWELLDHTAPLFSVDRTREPFGRLLQAHVGLIMQMLGPQSLTREDWSYFMLLRAGSEHQKRSMAIARWFGEIVNPHQPASDGEGGVICGPSTSSFCLLSQQRRLQLLPMLWLTMLGAHIHQDEATPQRTHDHLSVSREKPTNSLSGAQSHLDKREGKVPAKAATWRAARYALLHLLPLFSREAKADASLWALLHLLYIGPERPRSGRVELGVLLCFLERHSIIANFIPPVACHHASGDPSSSSRAHFLLQRWMRSLLLCSTAPSSGTHTELLEPLIASLTGLYVACTKLPFCVLPLTQGASQTTHERRPRRLPSTTIPSSTASGFDGVHFLTVLLYRIFIQWSSSDAITTTRGAGLSMLRQRFQRIFKDIDTAADAGGAPQAVTHLRRIQIRSECCAEFVFMLKAVHRLYGLHQCAIRMQHPQPPQGCGHPQERGDDAAKGAPCGSAGTLMLVIEAITRGFTWHLGEVVFPQYLKVLQESGESTLSAVEKDLLGALHATLTGILLKGPAEDTQEGNGNAVRRGRPGEIPSTYYEGIEALFSGFLS